VVNLDRGALFSLEGRTAVLTGASGFLGRTMARTLLMNGARIVMLGRSDRVGRLRDEWGAEFGRDKIAAHQVDMYDFAALRDSFAQIAEEETSVDVLVNNAHELGPATGFNVPGDALEHATMDHWIRNFTGGVAWPALAVQTIGVRMRERGRGSIINVATMYAAVAPSPQLYEGTTSMNPPAYSAAKSAMMAFTRYVASFWGPHGVRANAILPGPFSNTEETGPNAVKNPEFLKRLERRTCLGRVGKPHELSGALLFLASDASSYVTGQGLVVDGGWTVT
jgi:NAD(P)-dependent dehydrogenase (short-subunit alcohol dehydrogenase family)